MKNHTNQFKLQIKEMGRQLDNVITYGTTTLHDELYAVTPLFEANLLKSVMKQLDIESSVDIPLGTVLNYQLGVLIEDQYEYLDFGNYVVHKSEKQEDTATYKITCYDKMLYAMQMNEDLQITYPITIKNYLTAIANKIGLQVANTNFYNQNQAIPGELYLGLDYTYRDILDEIAQATGSNICINSNDEIEVRYFTNTNDTINEEYLKDVNVQFSEKYGPINSIVLSRAGESDNVYIQNPESVQANGLCEVKIIDNQIMNGNNRSDYLTGILNALNGLSYYINDFSSTGICYYDLCDIFNIQIGENSYQCVMLNDEINITSGLEELIHTDKPEEAQTDYTKADKTDRRINQTYIIVDKQNQTIESVVSNVSEQDTKINRITQTVDELNSKISDVADITTSQETNTGSLNFEKINQSEPIRIEIHPTGVNISYLYPRSNLYPKNDLYMQDRKIRFENTDTSEVFEYILPTDLLYYDSNNYDEFILDYDSQTCIVNKKVGYNADGTTYVLAMPTTIEYPYPQIELTDGDYTISLPGYSNAYLFARLMSQNIYTTQFTTKAEMNSEISQTANSIISTVSSQYETKQDAQSNYSQLQQTDLNISSVVATKVGNNEIISKINQSSEAVSIDANKISLAGKQINLTGDNTTITSNNFNVDKYGNMSCTSANINGGSINLTSEDGSQHGATNFNITKNGRYVSLKEYYNWLEIYNSFANVGARIGVGDNTSGIMGSIGLTGIASNEFISMDIEDYSNSAALSVAGGGNYTYVRPYQVKTPQVIQTSLESEKKNFEKLENGLDIIKATDIYKYNFKTQNNDNKKHIGFVIGDKFRYSEEITSEDNDGADIYSMVSVCFKAIQEQQAKIERLEEIINNMEGEKQ